MGEHEGEDILSMQRPWLIADLCVQGVLLAALAAAPHLPGPLTAPPPRQGDIVTEGLNVLLVFFAAYVLVLTVLRYHPLHRLNVRAGRSRQSPGAAIKALLRQSAGEALRVIGLPGIVALQYNRPRGGLYAIGWLALGVFLVVMLLLRRLQGLHFGCFAEPVAELAEDDERYEQIRPIMERAGVLGFRNVGVGLWGDPDCEDSGFAALAGPTDGPVLLLSRGFFTLLSAEEREAVIFHEVAHWAHRDPPRRAFLLFGLDVLPVAITFLYLWLRVPAPSGAAAVVSATPTAILLGWLALQVCGPLLLWLSRRRERAANEWALEHTRNPAAFCSAMRKLAEANHAGGEPTLIDKLLFATHPSLSEALEQARRYAQEHDMPDPNRLSSTNTIAVGADSQ